MIGSLYDFLMKWIHSFEVWCCSCSCSCWSGNDREPKICNKHTTELTHEEIISNIRADGYII